MKNITRHINLYFKVLFATTVALIGFSGIAKAESFSMNPETGKLNLGFAFKNQSVLPAPNSIGPTPLPDLWQAKDTITLPGQPGVDPSSFKPAGCLTPVTFTVTWAGAPGTAVPNDGQDGRPGPTPNDSYPCGTNPTGGVIDGEVSYRGAVTVEADDFRFPIMVIPSPLDGSPVPITLAATGELSGNYNNQTGGLSLAGPIEARVLVGLSTNPLGEYCAVPLPGLTLSTDTSTPGLVGFSANPFSDGLDGAGSLTGTWLIENDATPVGGADCERVNGVIKGLGGLWLGVDKENPDPYPTCPAGTVGSWPDCNPEPVANMRSVKAAFSKKRVKAGSVVVLRVSVKNSGDKDGTALIKLEGNRKKLRYKRSVSISVPANSTATVKVKVRVLSGVRAGARVWAYLGEKSSTSAVNISR